MKNQVLTSLIGLGFAALLGTLPAAAQPRQTATIPFVFEINGVEYPEGPYTIQLVGTSRVVMLTNRNSGHSALVAAPILTGPNDSTAAKLVFTRGASAELKLSEIWFYGHPGMLTMARSKDVSASVTVNLK